MGSRSHGGGRTETEARRRRWKEKKKRKRKDLSKESLRINRGWICLLLFLGNV